MKKSSLLLICLVLINLTIQGMAASTDTLQIICTPRLKNLADSWAEGYAFSSGVITKVKPYESSALSGRLKKGVIVLAAGDEIEKISSEESMMIVVGRDVVVPVINSQNPYSEEIAAKGIPTEKLAEAVNNPDKSTWGFLLAGQMENKATIFCIDEEIVNSRVARLAKSDEAKFTGILTSAELLSRVTNDKYSIGFCRLADIQDEEGSILEGIKLVPIDRNNNGLLDYNESIYNDLSSFARGVWIGKYPRDLYSNIYSFSSSLPEDKDAKAFLNWVLGDGQQILGAAGITPLVASEKLALTDKINSVNIAESENRGKRSVFTGLLLALAVLIILFLMIDYIYRTSRRKAVNVTSPVAPDSSQNKISFDLPGGLYFDKTHTWAFLEQTGFVKVGIDDFILHMTGPLSRIYMKKAGDKVRKGEEILSLVQNGKKLTLYAPVSGTIRERNSELENDASIVNKSPYTTGWVYRIEPENWQRENQLLFMAEKQKQFISGEISKIKDLIAAMVNQEQPEYALVLQDGGMLHDGLLSQMGPDVWEEFQLRIIDPSRQVWFYEIF